MFSQLFVIVLGVSLIYIGVVESSILQVILGGFVAFNGMYTLVRLKTGKVLTIQGFKSID